jgi:hypothetical protein
MPLIRSIGFAMIPIALLQTFGSIGRIRMQRILESDLFMLKVLTYLMLLFFQVIGGLIFYGIEFRNWNVPSAGSDHQPQLVGIYMILFPWIVFIAYHRRSLRA